jgi:hypothetical protein
MKAIPTDPFALQARIMDALIDDILDPNAATFKRLDALRQVMQSQRGPASVQQTAGGNHGE